MREKKLLSALRNVGSCFGCARPPTAEITVNDNLPRRVTRHATATNARAFINTNIEELSQNLFITTERQNAINTLGHLVMRGDELGLSYEQRAKAAYVLATHMADGVNENDLDYSEYSHVQSRDNASLIPYGRSRFAGESVELTLKGFYGRNVLSSQDYDTLQNRFMHWLNCVPPGTLFDYFGLKYAYSEVHEVVADFSRVKQARADAEANAAPLQLLMRARPSEQSVHSPIVGDLATRVMGRMRAAIGRPSVTATQARSALETWLTFKRDGRGVSRQDKHRYSRAIQCLKNYPEGNYGHGQVLDRLLPEVWTYLNNHVPDEAKRDEFREGITSVLYEQVDQLAPLSYAGCARGMEVRLCEYWAPLDARLNPQADTFIVGDWHRNALQELAGSYNELLDTLPEHQRSPANFEHFIESFRQRVWFQVAVRTGVAVDELRPHVEAIIPGFNLN